MKPEAAVLLSLIHSIWVVMLLMVFGMPLPILASPFSPDQILVGHEGQIQTSIAYGGNSLSEFDYDFVAMLVSDEKEKVLRES
jgi:hypothetical protein